MVFLELFVRHKSVKPFKLFPPRWAEAVANLNVEVLADMLEEAGASVIVFTSTWAGIVPPTPNVNVGVVCRVLLPSAHRLRPWQLARLYSSISL